MDTSKIEKLIEKYYEGESTLDEEMILKDFFRSGDVPSHLAEHASLFAWIDETSAEEADADFEIKLPDAEIEKTRVVPLWKQRPLLSWVSGIAAGLIILAGLYFMIDHQKTLKQREALMAYQQTQEALMLFSVNLNTGLEQVKKFSAFGEGMDQVRTFSTFYKYQSIIINPDNDKSPQNNYQ